MKNLFGPQTALFTRLTLRMLFFMEKTTVNKNIKIISVLVGVFYSFDLIFPMFPWCFLRFSNDLFCVSFNFLSIFSVFTYFSKMFSTFTYRSASCVAAYLMLKHDWDALRALKHIRQFRQIEVS